VNRSATNCPTEKSLVEYLWGSVDETLREQIGDHLTGCESCEKVAQRIEASSDFQLAYRDLSVGGQLEEDPVNLGLTALFSRRRVKIDNQTLIGMFEFPNYQIHSVIGRGGMGIVFKALQHSTNRTVALKVMNPSALDLPGKAEEFQARFAREVESAARIEHDNVVTVFDSRVDAHYQFCAMQLVEGSSLWQLVKAGLSIHDSARYVRDAASGISAAHDLGIVHRDVKPQNILICETKDRAMVSDFGLAKDTELNSESIAQTGTDWIVGTLDYISPEQLGDASVVGKATDIYSLGATLYFCLTGVTPFARASVTQQLNSIANLDPVPPSQLNPEVSPDLEAICFKCLEKVPSRRYASASELGEDLDRYLAGKPTIARPVGPVQRLVSWSRRYPVYAGLIATVFGLLLTGLIAGLFVNHQTNRLNGDLVAANEKKDELASQLQTSLEAEKQALRDAEIALEEAQRFTRNLSVGLAESPELLKGADGMQELRHELLSQAKKQLEFFLAKRKDDAAVDELVELQLADALISRQLGNFDEAVVQLQNVEVLCREQIESGQGEQGRWKSRLGSALHGLAVANSRLGKGDQAVGYYEESWRAVSADVTAEDSNRLKVVVDCGNAWAKSLLRSGKTDLANEVFDQAVLAANRLRSKINEQLEAGASGREYIGPLQSIVRIVNSIVVERRFDIEDDGLTQLEDCLTFMENLDGDLLVPTVRQLRAGTLMNLSVSLRKGEPERSMKLRRLAVDEYRDLVLGNEKVADFKFNFCLAARNLGSALANNGNADEGLALIDEASEAADELMNLNPDSDRFMYAQAMVQGSRAVCHGSNEEFTDAAVCFEKKLELLKARLGKQPKSLSRIYSVGFTHFQLAECETINQKPVVAFLHLLDARNYSAKLQGGAKKHLESLTAQQFEKLLGSLFGLLKTKATL